MPRTTWKELLGRVQQRARCRVAHVPPIRRSVVVVLWLACVAAPFGDGATGQPATAPSSHEVMAAYLYNFSKFVVWPDRPAESGIFSIGVLADEPFASVLKATTAGRASQGRPIVVRHFAGPNELQPCEIVFIPASESGRLRDVLDDLRGRPVLTVSDMANFTDRGGVIQFTVEGRKLRFEVNVGAANEAGLKVSSQLLQIAAAVKGAAGAEN